MIAIRDFKLLAILLAATLTTLVNDTEAKPLSESWQSLLGYQYKPVTQPEKAAPTLASIWSGFLADYPSDIMRRPIVTKKQLLKVPEKYRKTHQVYKSGSEGWITKMKPYESWINEASQTFNIPVPIIQAVIMQESSGNPKAKAKTSSAKGLMQTIDGTFEMARQGLAKQGINVTDPLNARDSIYAGSWYLAHCYSLVENDFTVTESRTELTAWIKPLEYYYAGPTWGKNPKPIVHAYFNGKTLKIDKAKYSDGVMAYAHQLNRAG